MIICFAIFSPVCIFQELSSDALSPVFDSANSMHHIRRCIDSVPFHSLLLTDRWTLLKTVVSSCSQFVLRDLRVLGNLQPFWLENWWEKCILIVGKACSKTRLHIPNLSRQISCGYFNPPHIGNLSEIVWILFICKIEMVSTLLCRFKDKDRL